jgi:transposase-like protein
MTKAVARDPVYRRRRFQSETIELCVRWYLTYLLSYRDLVEMMAERAQNAPRKNCGLKHTYDRAMIHRVT